MQPRNSPIIPAYGELSLADLSACLLASLGAGTAAGGANVLGLPATKRACLLVVDGMGWEQLRGHQAAAPFLSELAFNSRPLTCGFPATTVTSLATIGTALVPGEHGLLGLQVAIPGEGRLLNGLHWPDDVDPASWQAKPTMFDRANAAGITAFHVADGAYEKTGLSRAALRGATYRPARSLGALAAEAVAALQEPEPVLVTVYTADLDRAGHQYGVSSPAWTYQLAHVDKLAEQIAAALPMGAVLYVTADHGMVNIGADDRIDVDATPQLREGVALLGGEPRARHVYAEPGAAADVLATWREVLGDRAWVASRDEAIKDGWFGPVDEAMRDRIGDVVAAATGTWALVASAAEPAEPPMVGMHGSLTPAEQLVPLLAYLSRLGRARGVADDILISADELAAALAGSPAPVVLDVRWTLGGPPGRSLYAAGHVPGAAFTDLDRDLAAPPGPGGRHPMPSAASFEAAMRRLGVRGDRLVVVYDHADSMAAARAWWLLRYFGHPAVRVLDGGFRAMAGRWPARGARRRQRPPARPAGRRPPGDFTAEAGAPAPAGRRCRRRGGAARRPARRPVGRAVPRRVRAG